MAERTLTYFISDLHLGASYIHDPLEQERRVVRWLESIAPTAKHLFLLGDVIDYWFEYRHVVPKGYTRFFGTLARLADQGVEITWFKGNHDIWIFGYLQQELGINVVDGSLTCDIDGRRFFMEHGDGVGREKRSFRFIRRLFRNKLCQRLYSLLPSSLTIPFAHGWSSSSRGKHSRIPAAGLFDPETDNLLQFSRSYLSTHPHIDYFIFGHKHLLVDFPVAPDSRLIILGDWIRLFSYAVWDGSELKVRLFRE